MIRDLNILFLSRQAYTAIIGGNSGEEELTISMSYGQDGRVALIVTAMSVDGGGSVLFPADSSESPLVLEGRLSDHLRSVMLAWATGGIQPNAEERVGITLEIEAILAKMKTTYGVC